MNALLTGLPYILGFFSWLALFVFGCHSATNGKWYGWVIISAWITFFILMLSWKFGHDMLKYPMLPSSMFFR